MDDIDTRLLPGERIVWSGEPGGGIMFSPRDWLLIPFSLFWGGFTIFWESMALKAQAPFPFALFGIPFVVVGLFLIFGRFILDAWLRSRMSYAITDQRILIQRSSPMASLNAISLSRLPDATLIEGKAGRGTIRFGQLPSASRSQDFGLWVGAMSTTPQFLCIEDARGVFALIQERLRRQAQ